MTCIAFDHVHVLHADLLRCASLQRLQLYFVYWCKVLIKNSTYRSKSKVQIPTGARKGVPTTLLQCCSCFTVLNVLQQLSGLQLQVLYLATSFRPCVVFVVRNFLHGSAEPKTLALRAPCLMLWPALNPCYFTILFVQLNESSLNSKRPLARSTVSVRTAASTVIMLLWALFCPMRCKFAKVCCFQACKYTKISVITQPGASAKYWLISSPCLSPRSQVAKPGQKLAL